ncbi:MAG: cupin domain-containing protein [Nanoarchaeota archaeon]|nr:cupin domain-containing protein [Nanoarchaeota archaeon]
MDILIKKPNEEDKKNAENWPIWEKEISEFPWEYDENETCLVLEGKAIVTAEDGSIVEFGAGDYVEFAKGLKCTWKIIEPIRKHYKFG